jgi:hypothetical protein
MMGVDHTAILAVGKLFDYADEVVDFLRDNNQLSEGDEEALVEEGNSFISEILYDREGGLECSCLNLYSGYGYYLGFRISCKNPDEFRRTFEEGERLWHAMFPNDSPEIIKTVRVS